MIEVSLLVPLLLRSVAPHLPAETQPELMMEQNQVAQTIPQLVSTDGFLFELLGCEETQNVREPYRCNFLIENIGNRAREISVYGDNAPQKTSNIVDSQGYQIFATSVTVAGTSQTFYAGTNARPGVPFRASIFFEAVPNGGVRFIDVSCVANGGTRAYFRAEFLLQ